MLCLAEAWPRALDFHSLMDSHPPDRSSMTGQFLSSPLSEVHIVQSMNDDIHGTDGCY